MAESLAESDPWVSSATWETLPTEPSRYADAERAMTMTTATNQTAKRRLVTVRHINEITGARGLRGCVQVRIGGWTVLSQKIAPLSRKKWAVGDLVVFFEIDSFLPNTCPFQDFFTTPEKVQRFRGKEGYRVRSRYHKGIFSQGLILPLNMFWDINSAYQDRIAKVGELAALEGLLAGSYQDVVGVVKWEDEVETTQDPIDIIGRPPVFIENPCWERAQNMEHEIFSPAKRDKVWQVTEKLDGKTMHVYKVSAGSKWMDCIRELSQGYPKSMRDDDGRGHLGVCSRSEDFMDSPEHLNLYWTTAKDSEITSKIWDIMYPNLDIQGELVGSSIEKNTMGFPEGEHRFIVFGIRNLDTGEYLNVKEVVKICKGLDIPHVPVIGYHRIASFATNITTLLAKADGSGSGTFPGFSEGFVFKSLDGRSTFKVVSNEWLKMTGK